MIDTDGRLVGHFYMQIWGIVDRLRTKEQVVRAGVIMLQKKYRPSLQPVRAAQVELSR